MLGVKAACGGLSGSSPHRLLGLKAWSPVAAGVWEGLGGVREEVCH